MRTSEDNKPKQIDLFLFKIEAIYFVNFLTLVRILLIPIVINLMLWETILGNFLALVVFLVASISDFFDGYFARKYEATSEFGRIIDPIADKLLVLSILITMLFYGKADWLLFISFSLILIREVGISLLRLIEVSKRLSALKVDFFGKLKTTIQIISLAFCIIGFNIDNLYFIYIFDVGKMLVHIAAFLTVYSAILYFLAYRRQQSSARSN